MWSLNPLSATLCQHIWENLFRVVKNNVILMQFGPQWRRGRRDAVAVDEDKEAKFFFFVSLMITQQFNNQTSSSMTTH